MLNVIELKKYFPMTSGIFRKVIGFVKAVDAINFNMEKGEVFSVVGESGSGKTTLAKTLMRIHKPTAGKIVLDGMDFTEFEGKELKAIRLKMQMVFQDPNSSLNPYRRVKDIIATPLEIHKTINNRKERDQVVAKLLELVELSPLEFMYRRPRALSGGEKQRVGIARALSLNPEIVILDEPTSSVDVSVQAKILELLTRLQREMHLTYLLITHNLSVVRNFADRIAVMYLGKIMEMATTKELFGNPIHPYTIALLSTIPVVSDDELKVIPKKVSLEGEIPSPFNPPSGCRFHTRCPLKKGEICESKQPEMTEFKDGHFVLCHSYS